MRQRIVLSLLSTLLLLSNVLPSRAQTGVGETPNEALTTGKILVACRAYTQPQDASGSSGDGQKVSDLAQHRRGPLISSDTRYARRKGCGRMLRQRGNGRHALIGALVGFGIGAAMGAKANKDPHARVSAPALFGGAGALVGASIGASHT